MDICCPGLHRDSHWSCHCERGCPSLYVALFVTSNWLRSKQNHLNMHLRGLGEKGIHIASLGRRVLIRIMERRLINP